VSIAILASRAQLGIEAPPVTIEVFLSGGLPRFNVVGMPETAVRESSDRVRGAIINSGLPFPRERITVSLAPADMRKSGSRFDLAIALGILSAQKTIPANSLDNTEFLGELSLNGDLRPVPGVLPAALRARDARWRIQTRPRSLAARCIRLRPCCRSSRISGACVPSRQPGQSGRNRATRGARTSRTSGASREPSVPSRLQQPAAVLPPMTDREALETAGIDSVLGNRIELSRWRLRPFRAPHHTASAPAVVGGGPGPRPGEISRAHNGVLFLDELPEFSRHVLEVLREPLEAGVITISRAAQQADFPARVQLVAAMNPCPCGYLGDAHGNCHCSRDRVASYRSKISGPLLDRIDLRVEVGRLPKETLRDVTAGGERSETVRGRVVAARMLALARSGVRNADLDGEHLETVSRPEDDGIRLLDEAIERFALSMRAYHRVLRVSRTIADLAGADRVGVVHVAEALSLRAMEQR
jgi:magnesium chelatase family protein